MYGADAQALETLAGRLLAAADQVERIRVMTRSSLYSVRWTGRDAEDARRRWDSDNGPRLANTANGLRAAADMLRKNAHEQVQASAGGTGGGAAQPVRMSVPPAGAVPAERDPFGAALRTVDGQVDPYAVLLGGIAGSTGSAALGSASHVFTAFSDLKYGWSIGDHLGQGEYADAALDGVEVTGDMAAMMLKRDPTPVTYAAGVAVQSWTEVVREARHVDWSDRGMHDLMSASLGDWGSAFGSAAKQMPLKIVKIFSF